MTNERWLRWAIQRYFRAQGYKVNMKGVRVGNSVIDGEAANDSEKIALEIKSAHDDIVRGIGQLSEALACGYKAAGVLDSSCSGSGDLTTGDLVESIGIAANTIPTTFAWYTFIFKKPYLLRPNTNYVIGVYYIAGDVCVGCANNHLNIGWDGAGTHYGNAVQYYSGWLNYPAGDTLFRLYGYPTKK